MPEYHLTVPVPPSLNHMYIRGLRFTRRGRPYGGEKLHPRVLRYRAIVQEVILLMGKPVVPDDASFHLTLRLLLDPRLDQDVSNSFKVLEDAIAANFGFDDRTVMEIHGYKRWDPANPRAEVVLCWDVLPAHCPWCEPGIGATTQVCQYHLAELERQAQERKRNKAKGGKSIARTEM